MTLREAIESRKRHKMKGSPQWYEVDKNNMYYSFEVVSDQWEIEIPKKELSREDIERAYRNGYEIWKKQPINLMGTEDNFLKILIQELGL